MPKKTLPKKNMGQQYPPSLSLDNIITPKTSGDFYYDKIKLSEITVDGQSVRDSVDDEHVIELAMSIAKNGLLEPIVLQKISDNLYQLVDGFHRLTAAHRLRLDVIPAHITDDKNINVKALALLANVVRKEMSLQEECNTISFLVTDQKKSISQICDITGKSRPWVEKRLMSISLPEDLKSPLFEETISVTSAEQLGRIHDESQRRWLTSYTISNRLNKAQLSAMVDQIIENPSIQSAVEAGEQAAQQVQETKKFTKNCQSCGTQRDITEITPSWTCKGGCPPKTGDALQVEIQTYLMNVDTSFLALEIAQRNIPDDEIIKLIHHFQNDLKKGLPNEN